MSRYLLPFPIALVLASPAAATEPIEGIWSNPLRSVTVRVGPCGVSFCGTVIRAGDEAAAAAARHGTRLVGSQLLSGLKAQGGKWRGQVFIADHGIHARANVSMVGVDRMRVEGCALGGLVCRAQLWAREGD